MAGLTTHAPRSRAIHNNDANLNFPNPQQATETHATKHGKSQRPSLVIPPTIRDERKLFVGGLPCDITSEEFHTFFAQFGALIDSIVMFDHDTNRSRGFGFVSFEDPQVASMLLAKGNENGGTPSSGHMEMRGKTIEIKPAEPKDGGRKSRGTSKRGASNDIESIDPNDQTSYGYYTTAPVMYLPSVASPTYVDYASIPLMQTDGVPYYQGGMMMFSNYPYVFQPVYADATAFYDDAGFPSLVQPSTSGTLEEVTSDES